MSRNAGYKAAKRNTLSSKRVVSALDLRAAAAAATSAGEWRRRRWWSLHAQTSAAGSRLATPREGAAPGAAPAGSAGSAAPANAAWHRRTRKVASWPVDGHEHEVPLVVPRSTLIDPNRVFLALAANAHEAAGRHLAGDGRRRLGDWRGLWCSGAASQSTSAARSTAAARSIAAAWSALLVGGLRRDRDDLEVVVRNRILVLLSKKLTLDEDVDAWREVVAVLRTIQRNRSSVLLTAERKFRLLLPDGPIAPDGQQSKRHHDGHDRKAHEERRHRITAVSALTV
jgi:hypothetical protein